MTLTVEALLPCPHCGERRFARVEEYLFPPDDDGPAWQWGFHVICDASGLDTAPRGCGSSSAWGETPEEAIAAWNRRATPLPADLAEWEKLAEGVTRGPWKVGDREPYVEIWGRMRMNAYPIIASLECEPRETNARWIAHCSPDNVLAALRAISAQRDEARAELSRLREGRS